MWTHIEEIGGMAFAKCENLEYVTIPEMVKTIGDSAFSENNALKAFTVGSCEAIARDVFLGCREDLVIYGIKGTLMETYAKENNIILLLLSSGINLV